MKCVSVRFVTSLFFTSLFSLSANAYQFEVEGGYSEHEVEGDAPFKTTNSDAHLGLTYYFEEIEDNGQPLSLAAFTHRASSLNVAIGEGEVNTKHTAVCAAALAVNCPPYLEESVDTETYSISASYVDSDSGWLVSGGYRNAEIDDRLAVESEHYQVGVGKYVGENTTVAFTYVQDSHSRGGYSDNTDAVQLTLFHLQELGRSRFFDTKFTFVTGGDDSKAYLASATYYFNKSLGLGLIGAYSESKKGEIFTPAVFSGSRRSKSYSVGVEGEWFLTDDLSIRGAYSTGEMEQRSIILIEYDTDTFDIGVTYRF